MLPFMGPPTFDHAFQEFYARHAQRWGLDPNPDSPEHHYDYRAAFAAGAVPDASGHWPSEFKDETHPRRYMLTRDNRVIDTITGEEAHPGTAPGFMENENDSRTARPASRTDRLADQMERP